MPAALKTPQLEHDLAPENLVPPLLPTPSSRAVPAPAPPAAPRSAEGRASSASGAAGSYTNRAHAASPAPAVGLSRVGERVGERGWSGESALPRRAPERSVAQAPEAGARRVPRRERSHRHVKPTLTGLICLSAVMGQLVLLLWLHGKTLAAARQVEKVDAQIAEVSNHIERTQERIAAFDSSPQIKEWAAQKGWKTAGHRDFDDTTKPDLARVQAQTQATDAPSRTPSGEAGTQ